MSSETEGLCKYGREKEVEYLDSRARKRVSYKCPHKAVKDGYCIFHHPAYWKENPDEVRKKFYKEVRSAVDKEENVICIGYNLPEISIKELNISKFGSANFSYCKFFQNANFSEAEFEDASFAMAEFSQNANFWRAEFNQDAYFFGAKFYRNAYFGESEFHQNAYFFEVEFNQGAYFIESCFHKDADFAGAKFQEAVFDGACFHKDANFGRAKFQKADFENAYFGRYANFGGTEFSRNANFGGVEFGYGGFAGAKFHQGANFIEAYFKRASFGGAYFYRNANFGRAKFQKADFENAYFRNAEFNEVEIQYADFSRSIFEDISVFKNVSDEFRYNPEIESMLLFHLVTFKNPQNVTFIHFPLSSLSFLMTDISNILIICDPMEIKKKGILSERLLRVTESQENKINNEYVKEAIETLRHLSKETVLAEYRNIRRSFERNRTFAEASELFIREMRMLRENLSLPEKVVHVFYDKISRYGESFLRPLGLLIGFAILLPPFIINYSSLMEDNLATFLNNYLTDLEKTVGLVFQLSVDHKYNIGGEVAIRLASVILLGNMFIAFRRRLERR